MAAAGLGGGRDRRRVSERSPLTQPIQSCQRRAGISAAWPATAN